MSLLQISKLSFSYITAQSPLFYEINQTFSSGWTALVGSNGCGKTTLLNLISGKLPYEIGTITPNLSSYLCQQDSTEEIPPLFTDPELINLPETNSLLGKLDIKDDWFWRWNELSGGEKKRCMIADALARNPEVLLIDEPANHLDSYSLNLLSNQLKEYNGIGIIISHDLAFLDSICSKTLLMEGSSTGTNITSLDCIPSIAINERNKNIEYNRSEKNNQLEKLKKLKTSRNKELQRVQKSKTNLSKKNINPKDHSTKAKIDAARITNKAGKASKKVANFNTVINKENSKLKNFNEIGKRKSGVNIAGIKAKGSYLLTLDEGYQIIAGDTLKLKHPYLTIKTDDRIILTGNNGTGKTSFLKVIMEYLSNKNSQFWYLPQEFTSIERKEIKDRVLTLDKEQQGDIFSIVYRLGSEPQAIMDTERPSPGETQKLLYGLAMIDKVPLLILDEPTNFLDILSVQSLIEALQEFEGAIIAVSHDKTFINSIGKEQWNLIKKGTLVTLNITTIENNLT